MTLSYITDDARLPRPKPANQGRNTAGRFKSASGDSYCAPILKACTDETILSRLHYNFVGNRGAAYGAITAKLGVKRRTLQAWARAVNTLGLDIVTKIANTPLDTANEVDALCSLPATERTDLLKELQRASGTSAVRRLNAYKSAERENQSDELTVIAGHMAGKPLQQQYRFFNKFGQAVAEVRTAEKRSLSAFEQIFAAISERDFAWQVAKDAQIRIDQMSKYLTADELDHVRLDIERQHAKEIGSEPGNMFAEEVEEIAQSLISLENGHHRASTFERIAA